MSAYHPIAVVILANLNIPLLTHSDYRWQLPPKKMAARRPPFRPKMEVGFLGCGFLPAPCQAHSEEAKTEQGHGGWFRHCGWGRGKGIS